MKTQQKAVIVTTGSERARGLDELNIALGRGWRVARISPMGGSGASRKEPRFAALVIIEREENASADVLHQVEEEPEEIVDEIVEGDGASQDVADDFDDPSKPS